MAGKPGETQHHTREYLQMRKAVWGTLLALLLLHPPPRKELIFLTKLISYSGFSRHVSKNSPSSRV